MKIILDHKIRGKERMEYSLRVNDNQNNQKRAKAKRYKMTNAVILAQDNQK